MRDALFDDFQFARFANRLRSSTNRFENCPAKSTTFQNPPSRRVLPLCLFLGEDENIVKQRYSGSNPKRSAARFHRQQAKLGVQYQQIVENRFL